MSFKNICLENRKSVSNVQPSLQFNFNGTRNNQNCMNNTTFARNTMLNNPLHFSSNTSHTISAPGTSSQNCSIFQYSSRDSIIKPQNQIVNADRSGQNKRKFDDMVEETKTNVITKVETNEKQNFCIFTGTVERILKWRRMCVNSNCHYEVIASVIAIQEGQIPLQKVMLLRDRNQGPILQMIYYINDHIDIENFYIGQMLRCVGRMIGPNRLRAYSIRSATEEEINTLQRFYYICDYAIAEKQI